MKIFVILVLLIGALCEAVDLWCQIFDKNTKSLQRYCRDFNGTVPDDCSEQILPIEPSEVNHFRIGGCDQHLVSSEIKTFDNIQVLDVSRAGFDSLNWLDLRLQNLKVFNASHNVLTKIPSWFFKNARKITEVDLSYNQLTNINVDAFQLAKHLTKIHLSNNQLHSSDHVAFGLAKNLEYVDLRQNRFWEVPVLKENRQLKEIHLELNPIRNFSCSYMQWMDHVSIFVSWKSVQTFSGDRGCSERFLHIVHNQTEGVFITSNGTYELHCHNQSFELLGNFTAGPNAFENVAAILPCLGPSIETINLANNLMTTLDSTAFKPFFNLTRLSLRNTNLSEFNFNAFVYQIEVNELDISQNNLKSLNNIALLDSRPWDKLRELNVSGNQLTDARDLIKHLKSIVKRLDLSGNYVGSLNSTSLEWLTALETLRLSNTSLSIADGRNPFERLYRLSAIDISHNNLENINIKSFATTLRVLSELHATNCQFKNASEVIKHLGPLTKLLDLSHNFVGKLNSQTFELFPYLKHLNLSSANISNISNDSLQYQSNLQTLDLSNNNLSEIDLGMVTNKLEFLDLARNNLTVIHNFTKSEFPRLNSIAISNNQLSCEILLHHVKHDWAGFQFVDDPYEQKHGENCFFNYTINAIIIGTILAIAAFVALASVFGPFVIACFKCGK